MDAIELRINGRVETVKAPPNMPLLWVIRDLLGLTGTKFSCGIGVCKACAVQLDGVAVPSCMVPIGELHGRAITTIEGLCGEPSRPLQRAWQEENVSQCGYCQPGQLITAAALLAKHRAPTDAQIDEAMGSVLCRCGTYQRIRKAVRRAARLMSE